MANKLADRGQRPHRAPHNKFSQGNFSKAISDRSGLEFPYNEMMFEWNGSFVHFSEFEQKHPQLSLMYFTDSETLENARPQRADSRCFVGLIGVNTNLFSSVGMQPKTDAKETKLLSQTGNVTVSTS